MVSNEKNADQQKYLNYGLELVDAVDRAIRPWLQQVIEQRAGGGATADAEASIANAIEAAASQTHAALNDLAHADVDAPLSGPLERIRNSMGPVTDVLASINAHQVRRDPMDIEMRPDDVYALGPLTFLDLGEDVHSAGITWGAAKAHLHMSRRNSAT